MSLIVQETFAFVFPFFRFLKFLLISACFHHVVAASLQVSSLMEVQPGMLRVSDANVDIPTDLPDYVPIHVHSDYSLLDGASQVGFCFKTK